MVPVIFLHLFKGKFSKNLKGKVKQESSRESIAIIQGKVEQESRKVKLESSRESLARILKGRLSKNLKGKV